MKIIYKNLVIVMFTILISACGNSTSTSNLDKNITQNLNVIEDTNDTAVGIEETNNTAVGIEETNNTAVGIEETNDTADVIEETNDTTDVIEETNDTAVGIEETNDTAVVIEDTNNTAVVIEDTNNTAVVIEDTNDTTDVIEDTNDTAVVIEETNDTAVDIEDTNDTAVVIEDTNDTAVDIEDTNDTAVVIEDTNDTAVVIEDTNDTADIGTNIAVNYEDAENQKTDNWTIVSNISNKATILNTYDDQTHSRVIYLDAKRKNNDIKSYDTFKFNGIANESNKFIQWDMKFNQRFTIRLNIETTKGTRWIEYIAKDTGAGIYNNRIVQGIGSNKTNNKWHTITRDLERDVTRYEADNDFIQINYMTIQGGGYIDNIKSYKVEGDLEVNKPVIVSKPGIVLTFDDSFIDNWNKMQNTFKEKGAVVTFFCNRWASHQNWELPDDQIALLKLFRDNGHEIAYHTSDHISTRDHKYDNAPNKAQAYLEDQILEGVADMRNKGFEPTSFSYPYMSEQPAHDVLIRQELPHIRAFFAHVTLTDDPANITLDKIRTHLEKLKEEKDIGIFLSHWIHYVGVNDEESAEEVHKYQISQEKLTAIIDMVNELGLEFYTLSEAHNIYMNQ